MWERLVAVIAETRPALGAILQHAIPEAVSREGVVLAFTPGSFYGVQADAADAKSSIADIAERVLGARPTVSVVYRAEQSGNASTLAQIDDERRKARIEATRKKALNHPMVAEALDLFDARTRQIEVRLDPD